MGIHTLNHLGRRTFLAGGLAGLLGGGPPAIGARVLQRPQTQWGAACGEVTSRSAVLWSRTDRPARLLVELSAAENFQRPRRFVGPAALESSDFTARFPISGLPAGTRWFYRLRFQDLDTPRIVSEPVTGSFQTAPDGPRTIRFAWSGDTAGQGYGIDSARGGMTTYRSLLQADPEFFVHCGDMIYADGPIPASIPLDDGSTWSNLVTEETSKVAESLAEFRGRFRYNLLDEHVRRFHSHTPLLAMWDDHETTNNWFPGERLDDDDRYAVKSVNLLAARARRAFFEYQPLAEPPGGRERIYRHRSYGPLLSLFLLDMRTYRGPNSTNRQTEAGPESALLGRQQLRWLKEQLLRDTAVWKVICADLPLGLIVADGDGFENAANGDDGLPLGREREIAELLRFLKYQRIGNVIWLTADVHYAASHYYDPQRAAFQDFDPFWEFVSGPLHAGTFGPNPLDATFGPQVRFQSVPAGMPGNRPPSEGKQYFGVIQINGDSRVLTVTHHDASGKPLWTIDLPPV